MIQRQLAIASSILFAALIAMAIYVWRLQRHELTNAQPAVNVEHVAPPTAGPIESVTVYAAYDNPDGLKAQTVSIPLTSGRQERAEALLHALLGIYTRKKTIHPLAAGAEIRDVFLVDPGVIIIDLNSGFVDDQVSGVLSEELTVASIVQTLAVNIPGLTRVKFLVDGHERDTLAGHADLSGFYDVSQVAELARELSPQ